MRKKATAFHVIIFPAVIFLSLSFCNQKNAYTSFSSYSSQCQKAIIRDPKVRERFNIFFGRYSANDVVKAAYNENSEMMNIIKITEWKYLDSAILILAEYPDSSDLPAELCLVQAVNGTLVLKAKGELTGKNWSGEYFEINTSNIFTSGVFDTVPYYYQPDRSAIGMQVTFSGSITSGIYHGVNIETVLYLFYISGNKILPMTDITISSCYSYGVVVTDTADLADAEYEESTSESQIKFVKTTTDYFYDIEQEITNKNIVNSTAIIEKSTRSFRWDGTYYVMSSEKILSCDTVYNYTP